MVVREQIRLEYILFTNYQEILDDIYFSNISYRSITTLWSDTTSDKNNEVSYGFREDNWWYAKLKGTRTEEQVSRIDCTAYFFPFERTDTNSVEVQRRGWIKLRKWP